MTMAITINTNNNIDNNKIITIKILTMTMMMIITWFASDPNTNVKQAMYSWGSPLTITSDILTEMYSGCDKWSVVTYEWFMNVYYWWKAAIHDNYKKYIHSHMCGHNMLLLYKGIPRGLDHHLLWSHHEVASCSCASCYHCYRVCKVRLAGSAVHCKV